MASDASNPLAGVNIWTTPSIRPPPGVTPNFVNPVSRAPMVRAGMFSVLPIMVVFVATRIYARVRLTHSLGVDDYLCFVSAATIIAYSGLVLSFMDKPEGRHGWDIPIGELLTNHYWIETTFASLILYSLSHMFTKMALLTLYHRIFKPVLLARWAIWLGTIAVILFYLSTAIGYIGLCARSGKPIWETMSMVGCSNNVLLISKAQGWYGLISDIYILVIPLWLVYGLNLTTKRKAAVMVVFSTGLAACVISAVSLVKRYDTVEQGADRTWENSLLFLYGTLEICIGLICSCMPVTMVVFKQLMTNLSTMWKSAMRYGTQLLTPSSRRNSNHPGLESRGRKQVPEGPVVSAIELHTLRTFIQRMFRSSNQTTSDGTKLDTIKTNDTIDLDYHQQLKPHDHGIDRAERQQA